MASTFGGSIVLDTILARSVATPTVASFWESVWQRSCACFRSDRNSSRKAIRDKNDHSVQDVENSNSTSETASSLPALVWNGVPPVNPLACLEEQGWEVLLDLLHAVRPLPLSRGEDLPPQEISPERSVLFFRDCQVLTAEERRLYDTHNVWAAYLDGCSIVVNHADTYSPWIAALCDDLQKAFPHVYANTYLTPPGAQTAPPHADDRDVFVFQVVGCKTWTVYKNIPVPYPYPDEQVGKDGRIIPREVLDGPKLMDGLILEPGDVLYLPRGYVHHATASPEEPSFHITIALATHDWTLAGVLGRELIPKYLYGSVEYRKAFTPPSVDAESLQTTLTNVFAQLKSEITAAVVHQHMQRKFDAHNHRAARMRQALFARIPCQSSIPPSLSSVVGYGAARQVRLSTRLRAATPEERASVMASSSGLHVRHAVADDVAEILGCLKQKDAPACRVQDFPFLARASTSRRSSGPIADALCPLTLLSVAKLCVEWGALALADLETADQERIQRDQKRSLAHAS